MLKIADSVDCAEVEIMNPYASILYSPSPLGSAACQSKNILTLSFSTTARRCCIPNACHT